MICCCQFFASLTTNGRVSNIRILSHYVRVTHYDVGRQEKLCDLINYSTSLSTLCHAGSDERTSSQYVYPRMELPEVWYSSGIFEHSAFICSQTDPFLHLTLLNLNTVKGHLTLLLALSSHRI